MKGSHKENLTESLNWWWSNSVNADTQFSEPRVRRPEERSKEKEVGNCQYTSALTRERLKLFFAQFLLISSGAVSDFCEDCASFQDRTGRLVVEGQSNPLFVLTSSWSFKRRSIAKVPRTSGHSFRTRQWWVQSFPCKNGETCNSRTWPIVWAIKFDDITNTFDRRSCTRILLQNTKNDWKGFHNEIDC